MHQRRLHFSCDSFEEFPERFSEFSIVDGVDERVQNRVDVPEPGGEEEGGHRRFEVRPVDLHGDAGPSVAHEEREPADKKADWKINRIFISMNIFLSQMINCLRFLVSQVDKNVKF